MGDWKTMQAEVTRLPYPTSNSTTRAITDDHIKIWCDHLDRGPVLTQRGRHTTYERKRIAYNKIGRSLLLDPRLWGSVGGDNEAPYMLFDLAARYPEIDWVVAGRHSVGDAVLPPNIITPDFPNGIDIAGNIEMMKDIHLSCDGAVLWVGQHGTTNMPTPQLNKPDIRTFPLDEGLIYVGPTINALNCVGPPEEGGYEPVWLCADPRNYLKLRDMKLYPKNPVLAQYNFTRKQRHFRWGDHKSPAELGLTRSEVIKNGHWSTEHSYEYSGLELTGVPNWPTDSLPGWDDRNRFGIIINENRSYVKMDREAIMKKWVMPLGPSFVHGKWSDKTLKANGWEFESIPYQDIPDVSSRAKSTFTTPASGSMWATAKPWEMFQLGVVCFFHPFYDIQGHIIPTLEQATLLPESDPLRLLTWWLRPKSPEELKLRVDRVHEDRDSYEWIVAEQRRLLAAAREKDLCMRKITSRLGIEYRKAVA